MFRWLLWVGMAGFAWFVIHSAVITIDGLTDSNPEPVDAIVILGNEVYTDGTLSPRLRARVDKGIELYRAGHARLIIPSGGINPAGRDEASHMMRYMIEQGIPGAVIIPDSRGSNTWNTARNVSELVEMHDIKSVYVVSQYYHITRTVMAFRRFGFERILQAHADVDLEWKEPYALLREWAGYYAYLLRSDF